MNIKERREALNKIVEEARSMLHSLREECIHPEGHYKYDGNTGNWSPSDDCYWKTFTCHHCAKEWTEYSELPGGRRNDEYHSKPKGQWSEKR